MSTEGKRTVRCAMYTRKSPEEGLDQTFNSLHAQREACEAYILSQRHEGWRALETHYDDGGFSGGSLERPAVKRVLADIEAKKIDTVVEASSTPYSWARGGIRRMCRLRRFC